MAVPNRLDNYFMLHVLGYSLRLRRTTGHSISDK